MPNTHMEARKTLREAVKISDSHFQDWIALLPLRRGLNNYGGNHETGHVHYLLY